MMIQHIFVPHTCSEFKKPQVLISMLLKGVADPYYWGDCDNLIGGNPGDLPERDGETFKFR